MAIAGLLIMLEDGRASDVLQRLRAHTRITEVQETGDAQRLAAVLETASDRVETEMGLLLDWDGVLTVDLAYLSYEDDMEDTGRIACPPHKARKHRETRTV